MNHEEAARLHDKLAPSRRGSGYVENGDGGANVAQQGAKRRKSIESIPESAMAAMEAYDWPGNVRELKNVIERAAILSSGRTLAIDTTSLRPGAAVERSVSRLPFTTTAAPAPTAKAAAASLEDAERARMKRLAITRP